MSTTPTTTTDNRYQDYELFLEAPLTLLPDDIAKGNTVYVIDHLVTPSFREYTTVPFLEELRTDHVGKVFLDDGMRFRFQGAYRVTKVDEERAVLELLSEVDCAEFEWCTGHSLIDPDGWDYHSSDSREMHVFEAGGNENGDVVRTHQMMVRGERRTGLFLRVETDLTDAGVLAFAVELERVAQKVRGLVIAPAEARTVTPAQAAAHLRGMQK